MFKKKQKEQPTPRWMIDKQIDFCYGHRVWSQQLNAGYCATGDACTKCRHLHGHQGEIHVFLEAPALERGMVTDFKHLGWFKDFVDDHLDHKFIIDLNDPWFAQIVNARPEWVSAHVSVFAGLTPNGPLNTSNDTFLPVDEVFVPGTDTRAGWSIDVSNLKGPEQEFFEGFFIVDFLPTSENLTKWMYELVDAKMSLIDVKVTKVTLNETPKSRAEYSVTET